VLHGSLWRKVLWDLAPHLPQPMSPSPNGCQHVWTCASGRNWLKGRPGDSRDSWSSVDSWHGSSTLSLAACLLECCPLIITRPVVVCRASGHLIVSIILCTLHSAEVDWTC
jgi:hypothetical protein